MKKLTSFFALLSICAYAYGFKMDGIYYNITGDNTVEVTGSEIYTGEINIPNSIYFDSTEYIITSIKSFAFSGYSGLTSINIPASVTNIGNSAFSCCSGLTSINIPAGVTNIGEYTFSACYGLTSINIPANVTTIENCAFSDCRGLESINIPASVTNIGEYAFISCSGLTSIVVESGNNVYDSRNNCNAIIKTSDNSLIRGCKNTIIPTSVTNIGNSAFDCCSDLTSINISASVTNIGNNAFQFCSGLTSIDIPASVTNIGEYAFYGCSGLISIVVESGNSVYDSRNNCNAIIKTNDNNLLLGCKNTVIPTGVTSIENLAFALCYDLTSINIPASVTNIGEYAFRDCGGLTSIVVENGNNVYDSRNNCNAIIKTNDNNLLLGCKNSIIPTGVTNIGEYAFAYCGGLTSINIPASVTNIGNNAFRGCNDLTSINFSAGVTNIGEYAFAYCRSLTSINIPASVTNIGGYAFEKCSSLTSINIPESVTSIATNTFSESGLTSLNIPASITNIGAWAFYLCDSLDDIYCYGSIPAHNDYAAFSSNTYSNCTLHVPYGTIDAYRTADDWKNFTNIVEFDPTNVEVVSAEGKPAAEQRIYNLGGVRMATPQKGLNIINGKKVVY